MSTQGTWTFSEDLTASSQQLSEEISLEFTDPGPRDEEETDTLPFVPLQPASPAPLDDGADSGFADDNLLDNDAESVRSDGEEPPAEVAPVGSGTVVKKPQTAYFLFVAAVRTDVKTTFPGSYRYINFESLLVLIF